ncbi:MAG: anthranilate synthase component I family protein [Bacteroidetes bacterium]|nr:anthranilate synthase component I family protein [Bacteroidota bacterium]
MPQRISKSFEILNSKEFKKNLLFWAEENFETFCLLSSNNYDIDKYSSLKNVFAAGVIDSITVDEGDNDAFQKLKEFADASNDWSFGFLSYDLKNQIERLSSENLDRIGLPLLFFFKPLLLIKFDETIAEIEIMKNSAFIPEELFQEVMHYKTESKRNHENINIKAKTSKKEYIDNVKNIKNHIQLGDIYEMNYCIEFFAEDAVIDPVECFLKLNDISPTPFSAFFKHDDKFLLCASPERFLKKLGKKIISQPIKGTLARGINETEDYLNADLLYNDQKERSENVMIVDLVRNDLSKSAIKGSVFVEELFGIYKFPKVFQMISTVSSELSDQYHYTEALKMAFPMGSMTGAPKIRAMQLAEEYETTKRGLYSGSIGYIDSNKDFDFNVVIRSVIYSRNNSCLSFMAGSAITIGSNPEKEYLECLLKAQSMASIFNHKLENE